MPDIRSVLTKCNYNFVLFITSYGLRKREEGKCVFKVDIIDTLILF